MIHLLRPEWLLLIPVGLILIYFAWRIRHRHTPWHGVVDTDLLPHILVGGRARRQRYPWIILAVGYVLVSMALAGPALKYAGGGVYERIHARVLVLDLSPSMNTPDVAPSRLERARFKIRDLLDRPGDTQYGLVVFSGDAFVVSPITSDRDTLLNLLGSVSTTIMPVIGNRGDRGIELALQLLAGSGVPDGEILLITDGPGEVLGSARQAAGLGVRLAVLGVGTVAGAPIPSPQGGFVKDEAGNIVIEGVNVTGLGKLAKTGNGLFAMLTVDESDLEHIAVSDSLLPGTIARKREETVTQWRDMGAWLLLPVVFLALAAFRRGWILLFVLAVGTPAEQVLAFSWQDLWARNDQQAARLFASGDFPAADAREDPQWSAASAYRGGDFTTAAEKWKQNETTSDLYNLGNAYARGGQLPEALAAYNRALEIEPELADAQHNRDLVERLLREQQKQQQQQEEGEQQSGEDRQQQSGDAGENSTAGSESNETDEQPPDEGGPRNQNGEQPHDDGSGQNAPESEPIDEGEEPAEAGQSDQQGQMDESQTAQADQGKGDEAGQAADHALEDLEDRESQQALEQWLRRIPDDPEGLLRRKFLYQYRQRRSSE